MSWTAEKEKKLKELWSKGHTASQIAALLGDTTRNAVIGKAHRLNLEARAVSKKTSSNKINSNNTERSNTPDVKTKKLGRKAKFQALLLDKNFEPENPKKLEELTDETCRWPIGHPYEEKFYFCGRKSIDKFPYCKLHVLYAFQPKNAKEEDQITEEDIPQFIEKKIKSA
ncbi:GcrA family cell cycle regulator [Pelagibacteraceae bacterium]|nr:GcrA family cell cycle regulator [Pelagibacteraceae bacterium]|tara:strand:+ start:4948 stop:5457 length:510 start_codon:yes stop_codon:yes gene_type:complete